MNNLTQEELTRLNVGQSLDDIMNIDPRGYGVCKILYKASREFTKRPLTINAAEKLAEFIKDGDIVYIITGFVLLPFKKAEMDGIIGSMLLARALVKAFNCKPVIICPKDNLVAVKNLAYDMGLHLYDSIEELNKYPVSMGVVCFTKNKDDAIKQSEKLFNEAKPVAVISIEAPSANLKGVYHNATGLDVSELEAKSDVLFQFLKDSGIPTFAIGDLGNEIGMGAIGDHIKKYIPYAKEGACRCGCNGGTAANTSADYIITATTSDWGAYGLIAALAYLQNNLDIMHTAELERQAIYTASRSGMIDMHGWLIPAIDGFNEKINVTIVQLMRECVKYPAELKKSCATWFEKVLELEFFS